MFSECAQFAFTDFWSILFFDLRMDKRISQGCWSYYGRFVCNLKCCRSVFRIDLLSVFSVRLFSNTTFILGPRLTRRSDCRGTTTAKSGYCSDMYLYFLVTNQNAKKKTGKKDVSDVTLRTSC